MSPARICRILADAISMLDRADCDPDDNTPALVAADLADLKLELEREEIRSLQTVAA